MTIRKATLEDIPRMQEIFAIARRFMAETGNPNQWADTYPSVEQLTNDITSGDSHVCLKDGKIVATFMLRGGNDPTYDKIYDGAWKNSNPYATIHRIASSGEVKGIFSKVMEYALQQYDTIRIDTHRDNVVMQNAIAKEGFEYCGIIHCRNLRPTHDQSGACSEYASQEGGEPKVYGDERLAYQLTVS
ncbi:MAG: GNAT family N-acetyltransferase [Prevotellaceae bacterium]|nr:GNAT family N-acetyltransferase [Candidatus Minthosoma caballi]